MYGVRGSDTVHDPDAFGSVKVVHHIIRCRKVNVYNNIVRRSVFRHNSVHREFRCNIFGVFFHPPRVHRHRHVVFSGNFLTFYKAFRVRVFRLEKK